MKNFSTLPYALKYFLLPFIVSIILFAIQFYISAFILLFLSCCILLFFRDPFRKSPNIQGAVICPADGKILSVEKIQSPDFEGGECICVKIFLSIFNVHIQRAPIKGNIIDIKYNKGKFLNALNDKSSNDNENNVVQFEDNGIKVIVKQIAGIIARRIVCKCQIGEKYSKGEKYGLICFGSRVEAYLPKDVEMRIKPGMKVFAGQTILGILPEKK